jgi:hypothetical protein
MKVGDVVEVTKQCDAGGLHGRVGIVTELLERPGNGFETRKWVNVARVLLSLRVALIRCDQLKVINESR